MNEGIRALLLRLAILLAMTLVADRIIAMGFRAALPCSGFRFSVAARGGRPAGILILGDSRAVNGFYAPEIERQLGTPVLNLAYNAMSTRIAEAVFRDYLDRNSPPRLLVLEVSNVGDGQGLIDGLMCYWDSGRALGALADSLRPRSRAATRLSHLFAFNGEASLRALYYARRSDQDWVNRYRIEPGLLRAARDDTSFSLEFREDNLAALGRIRRLARERGVPVRLVITPYLPAYAAHMRDSGPWLERIHATGDRKERLWDYRNAEPDSRHFADRVHVNDQGSIPFAARLVRDGFFSDPAR